VSEAILTAADLRAGVVEFYAQHQRFPDAAEGVRIAGEPVSRRVQSIVWDPGQRAIVVTMRDPFPGKRFALRAIEDSGQLRWKCGPIDLDRKHLPSTCRD